MKLYEYQAKSLFAKNEIPISEGQVAENEEEARHIASGFGAGVMIKAQVLSGGRGKAGGVRLARNSEEAAKITGEILELKIGGYQVRNVLVEQAIVIKQEIYLAITNDRAKQCPVLIASGAGGVDIEDVAKQDPDRIAREYVKPFMGLCSYQVRNVASEIGLPSPLWPEFIRIAIALYGTFVENDATIVEINPLVVDEDDSLLAVDAKVVLDENALMRQPEMREMIDWESGALDEMEARRYGVSYIALDGQIGCLVNGAGLAMGTMDIIEHFGGEPANFLDIGGGANAEKVAAALRIILRYEGVRTVLVNIFGGITRCDEVARGLLAAVNEVEVGVPIVVRLVGNNGEEGLRLLDGSGLIMANSLVDAVKKAIEAADGGGEGQA